MTNSSRNDGMGIALIVGGVMAGLMVLMLIAAGGVAFVWQRQQVAAEQAASQARQTAELQLAVAERQRAYALQLKSEAAEAQPESTNEDHEVSDSTETAVLQILETQQQAWNDGDIDRFMQHYWKSDELTFSSEGKVTKGWQATLDNYHQRYPSRDDMGTLEFANLEITSIEKSAALVLGEWHLARDSNDVGGNFTLILRQLDGEWVIVHDHTSRLSEP